MQDVPPWRSALDEARAALLALVRELPQDAIARRPPPGAGADEERWPVRDVLWHIADVEATWHDWAAHALRSEPFDAFARRRRPAQVNTLPQLLARLDETRAATLALVTPLEEAALGTTSATPWGTRSLHDMLALFARHDRDHAAQIASALGKGEGA